MQSISTPQGPFCVLTLLGTQLDPALIRTVEQSISQSGFIAESKKSRAHPVPCLELILTCPDFDPLTWTETHPLKLRLTELCQSHRSDFAFRYFSSAALRTPPALAVFDMDSTLIQCEIIDELARHHGVYEKVSEVTRQAMEGKLDFTESLRRRVALLAGLQSEDLEAVYSTVQLMPGAEALMKSLHKIGCKTGILSGGFSFAAERIQKKLGMDFSHSNVLEVQAGRLTGRVLEPIVHAQRKADLLTEWTTRLGLDRAQTLAVGDGANDLLMLAQAGLGVAFHAKPITQQKASVALNHVELDALICLF